MNARRAGAGGGDPRPASDFLLASSGDDVYNKSEEGGPFFGEKASLLKQVS